MGEPHVIAEIREYGEFTAGIRKWILQVGTNYACVNDLAGLQDGYLHKLIAESPIRNFGPLSLGPTLGALGLKLLLVIDAERLAKMRSRYVARKKHAHADDLMPTKKVHYLRRNSEFMRLLRLRGVLKISPRRRRELARHAAKCRWRNGAGQHTTPAPEGASVR
jgi:hypothetical protein